VTGKGTERFTTDEKKKGTGAVATFNPKEKLRKGVIAHAEPRKRKGLFSISGVQRNQRLGRRGRNGLPGEFGLKTTEGADNAQEKGNGETRHNQNESKFLGG